MNRFSKYLLLLPAILFLGCIKDEVTTSFTYQLVRPVYKTVAQVREEIKSAPPQPIGEAGKLSVKDQWVFVTELYKGVHIIDNSNPAAPRNTAFIAVPGCVDIAIKGNILYADLYTDLVAIDIANPAAAKTTAVLENAFPDRYYFGIAARSGDKIVVDYIKTDTTVTNKEKLEQWARNRRDVGIFAMGFNRAAVNAAPNGSAKAATNGSMARFAIVANRLYTVGNRDLSTFNIDILEKPRYISKTDIGWGIETIYPFKNRLFIGSMDGMYIYNISNPDAPARMGQFTHARSCDPVIADDNYAYVTLRSGNMCAGFTNQMEVVDVNNLLAPKLVKTYQLTNPHGLSKDGNLLFICDGRDGLKSFDASSVTDVRMIQKVDVPDSYDVIAYDGVAVVVAKDGLYQYRYGADGKMQFLSKMGIAK